MKPYIEIESEMVTEKTGTKNGRDWSLREQVGYFHDGKDKYPKKVCLRISGDDQPYPKGKYEISPESFFVGQYDQLRFNPKLVSMK